VAARPQIGKQRLQYQVAEWAGHSVEVLLRTCVRCLDGQHDIAKRRIMEALDDPAVTRSPL
jgi:hypothetical protein